MNTSLYTPIQRPYTIKKYVYVVVIQQNYGFGWEDVETFPCDCNGEVKELDKPRLKRECREYKRTGFATRQVFERIKNPFF